MYSLGHILAFLGAGVAFIGGGIGSSIAVAKAGQSVAGVIAENPKLFSKCLPLQLLPATQGIYGFIIGFLILLKIGALGAIVPVTVDQGWSLLVGALPVSVVGFASAIFQGKVASSAIVMVGKNPTNSGKAISMVAVVETYAIFGLLISFLSVFMGVQLG